MKRRTKWTKEEWVVMANNLAERRAKETIYALQVVDRKLFAYLVAHLEDLGATEFPKQHVDVQEFASRFGYGSADAGTLYRDMKAAVTRLMRTLVEFPHPSEPGVKICTQLLAPSKYHDGEGWFELQISKEMAPALLHLTRSFFQYKLENIGKLGSGYAVQLYELLKSREKLASGYAEYELEELRRILGVPEGKLKSWFNFRARTLDYALEQINQETDIRATYEPRKRGRRVTGVLFHVRSASPNKERKEPQRAKLEPESFKDLTEAERKELWEWIKVRPAVYGEVTSTPNWALVGEKDIQRAFGEWMSDQKQQKISF